MVEVAVGRGGDEGARAGRAAYFWKYCDSSCSVAEKAQQLPHCPWFLIGDRAPLAFQSTDAAVSLMRACQPAGRAVGVGGKGGFLPSFWKPLRGRARVERGGGRGPCGGAGASRVACHAVLCCAVL